MTEEPRLGTVSEKYFTWGWGRGGVLPKTEHQAPTNITQT